MIWKPEQDRALLAARMRLQQEEYSKQVQPGAEGIAEVAGIKVTPAAIAARYQEMTGEAVTKDQVDKRLRRLDERAAMQEDRTVTPSQDEPFKDIEVPPDEFVGFRTAFFDIETTDLKAMMGRILCWSIADNWGHITHARIYDFPQDSIIDDRGVCIALRDELEKYDHIVGHNSKMFDISMLNARLMRWGERPCLDRVHMDTMWKARAGSYGLRVGSSKLVNVDKFFNRGDVTRKTEIEWDIWALAQAGDKQAMDYIQEHCDHDVLVLRSVWNHLKPLFRNIGR